MEYFLRVIIVVICKTFLCWKSVKNWNLYQGEIYLFFYLVIFVAEICGCGVRNSRRENLCGVNNFKRVISKVIIACTNIIGVIRALTKRIQFLAYIFSYASRRTGSLIDRRWLTILFRISYSSPRVSKMFRNQISAWKIWTRSNFYTLIYYYTQKSRIIFETILIKFIVLDTILTLKVIGKRYHPTKI